MPGKSPVEVQPEILDIILLRKVYVIYMDWWVGLSLLGECDMDRLGFVGFHPPISLTIFVLHLGGFAVSVKQCLGHCQWLILQYHRKCCSYRFY
jgi:hypothetical protein